MTRDEFESQWVESAHPERWRAFVSWLTDPDVQPDAVGRVLDDASIYELDTLRPGELFETSWPLATYFQVAVLSSVFDSPEPSLALMVGDTLISLSLEISDRYEAILTELEFEEMVEEWLREKAEEAAEDEASAIEAMNEFFHEQEQQHVRDNTNNSRQNNDNDSSD
jgi:hypothetical protein